MITVLYKLVFSLFISVGLKIAVYNGWIKRQVRQQLEFPSDKDEK